MFDLSPDRLLSDMVIFTDHRRDIRLRVMEIYSKSNVSVHIIYQKKT